MDLVEIRAVVAAFFMVKVLKQARESLQAAWEDDGSAVIGNQILETINAIDALLGGEKDA